MELKQYIKETEATEAPAIDVLNKVRTQEGYKDLASFRLDVQDTIKSLNKLDKWKKNIFYGKPLGFDKQETGDAPTCYNEILDEKFIRLIHGSLGIATESNELLEALEKALSTGKIDAVNISEEIGDVMFYVGVLCNALGIDLENILERNNAKLQKRYPDKFSAFRAINRDLQAERKILEA